MVDEAILTVWESKTDRRANLRFSNGNTSSRRGGFSTAMLDYWWVEDKVVMVLDDCNHPVL